MSFSGSGHAYLVIQTSMEAEVFINQLGSKGFLSREILWSQTPGTLLLAKLMNVSKTVPKGRNTVSALLGVFKYFVT